MDIDTAIDLDIDVDVDMDVDVDCFLKQGVTSFEGPFRKRVDRPVEGPSNRSSYWDPRNLGPVHFPSRSCQMWGNVEDARAIFRKDMRFYIGPWTILKSFYGIHVLLAY